MHKNHYELARKAAAREAALRRVASLPRLLMRMKGWLLESAKDSGQTKKIRDVMLVDSNQKTESSDVSAVFDLTSDVCDSLPVHIYASVQEKIPKKHRLNRLWPTQTVLITDEDDDRSILTKIKQALINGYNHVRREVNHKLWRIRNKFVRKLKREQRHPHHHPERVIPPSEHWCPRFSFRGI